MPAEGSDRNRTVELEALESASIGLVLEGAGVLRVLGAKDGQGSHLSHESQQSEDGTRIKMGSVLFLPAALRMLATADDCCAALRIVRAFSP